MSCTPCEQRKRAREARIEARRRGVSPPASASAARSVHERLAAIEGAIIELAQALRWLATDVDRHADAIGEFAIAASNIALHGCGSRTDQLLRDAS